MHRLRILWAALAAVAVAAAAAGCLPNRAAVSPDGKTLYFGLAADGRYDIKDGEDTSNLYALDIESGRIRALTGGAGAKFWCTLSSDGEHLAYMAGVEKDAWAIEAIALKTGARLPLLGMLQKNGYPWLVPGKVPYVLTMENMPGGNELRWALRGLQGRVNTGLPPDHRAIPGNVALAEGRFAVPVYREVKPEGAAEDAPAKKELSVYVVDLAAEPAAPGAGDAQPTSPQVASAVCVARWEPKADNAIVDLAFAPDGSRLVAAVLGGGEGKEDTRFYEFEANGPAPPKVLFDVPRAYSPRWTPDGTGIVYLCDHEAKPKYREVQLRRRDGSAPVVLARLPGEVIRGSTMWHWMNDGRVRIYHVSFEGVHLIETAADGSGAKGRHLTHDRLAAQQALTDLEWAMTRMPDPTAAKWPEPLAAKMAAVGAPLKSASKSVEEAAKEAWAAAAVWEDVPAAPPPPETEKVEAKAPAAPK